MTVKSSPAKARKSSQHRNAKKLEKPRFKPGMTVAASGVYEAFHGSHRISHEVPLIAGQQFPFCSRCKDRVRFELVKANPALNEANSPLVHVIGVFVPEAA
jgi:hypothetical protein